MRIMIISDAGPPQVNGVVTTLENTRAELQGRGMPVHFITPSGPEYSGEKFKTLKWYLLPEIEIPVLPGKLLEQEIDYFLKFPGPHAFHISTESTLGLSASRILVRRGIPFTTSYHTDFPAYAKTHYGIPEFLTWKYLKWFHNRAAAVLVSTDAVTTELEQRGFNNITRWGRGVNQEIFKYKELVLDTDHVDPICLYGGRVSKEKNIEAFLKLGRNSWIAGHGPHSDYLMKTYKARYLGTQTPHQMAGLMQRADCFVFPSHSDTFGLVMAEAACCGCPVAAYPCQGPIDVIEHGVTGWLDEDLNVAIKNALTLDRRKVAEAARERFSWATCTDQFLLALPAFESVRSSLTLASDAVAPSKRSLIGRIIPTRKSRQF
jgi:glycosyltransferase involved in cell wall biosynthesis